MKSPTASLSVAAIAALSACSSCADAFSSMQCVNRGVPRVCGNVALHSLLESGYDVAPALDTASDGVPLWKNDLDELGVNQQEYDVSDSDWKSKYESVMNDYSVYELNLKSSSVNVVSASDLESLKSKHEAAVQEFQAKIAEERRMSMVTKEVVNELLVKERKQNDFITKTTAFIAKQEAIMLQYEHRRRAAILENLLVQQTMSLSAAEARVKEFYSLLEFKKAKLFTTKFLLHEKEVTVENIHHENSKIRKMLLTSLKLLKRRFVGRAGKIQKKLEHKFSSP